MTANPTISWRIKPELKKLYDGLDSEDKRRIRKSINWFVKHWEFVVSTFPSMKHLEKVVVDRQVLVSLFENNKVLVKKQLLDDEELEVLREI